ncbi:MAG: leucine-rich repeat domain-containing protein [Dysgonamonadaceae bacterium]|nr:leucine-rich repeat domain-containing protein [Dysgonamonadaceae bacterium]
MKHLILIFALTFAAAPAVAQKKSFAEQYLELRKGSDKEIYVKKLSQEEIASFKSQSFNSSNLTDEENRKVAEFLDKKLGAVTFLIDNDTPADTLETGKAINSLISRQEELVSMDNQGLTVRIFIDEPDKIMEISAIVHVGDFLGQMVGPNVTNMFADIEDKVEQMGGQSSVSSNFSIDFMGTPIKISGDKPSVIINLQFNQPVTEEECMLLMQAQNNDKSDENAVDITPPFEFDENSSTINDNGQTFYFRRFNTGLMDVNADNNLYIYTTQPLWTLVAPPEEKGIGYLGDNITIPQKITHDGTEYPVEAIGHVAFHRSDLSSVVLPEGLQIIGAFAFASCKNLKSIVIPVSVQQIASNAFQNCGGLERIEFPNKPLVISDFAFSGCESLKEIDLPDSICYIDEYAFAATGLQTVRIPEGVHSIGGGTFSNCLQLKSVTFPKHNIHVDEKAFFNCPQLKEIIFQTDDQPFYIGFMGFYKEKITVKVPKRAVEKYRKAAGWKDFRIEGI